MSYKKELQEFIEFKKNYKFKQLKINERKDGSLYCKSILLRDNNTFTGECEKWINVGYSLKGIYPKLLSNLFPYEFKFKGFKLNSIESFFQGIKFPDKKLQKKVFKYSGKEALVLQNSSDYNWKETGILYWQGKPIKRDSAEYDLLIDELYISAAQNPIYRSVLINCDRPIIHSIGENEKNNTTFTRYEFEFELNCLKDFLQNKEKGETNE